MALVSVAAVVVSFEAREHLERCLTSLREDAVDEVIVVDNDSSDGSAQLVRERFPDMPLLALDRNLGFGAACNLAARQTTADFLLLLNPDTVVRSGATRKLRECIETNAQIAVAAPTLLNADGSAQLSLLPYPGIFASGRAAITAFPVPEKRKQGRRELVDSYPVGAALLVRRRAFADIGGFDDGFFHFYEEVDLCKRLRAAGWTICLCPEAEIAHVGGGSSASRWPSTYVQQLRGHIRYVAKHRGRIAAETARMLLVGALFARLLYMRGEQRKALRAGLRWLLSARVIRL